VDLLTRAVRNAGMSLRSANPANTFGDSSIPSNSQILGNGGGGSVVTESGALAIQTVLNCLRVLSDDIGILPFGAYQGEKRGVKSAIVNQPQIVAEPFGPDISPSEGMGQITVSMRLRGNSYLWVVAEDKFGFPMQVATMHPDRVQPGTDSLGQFFTIAGKKYRPDQVKHIKGMMLPGATAGIDPVSYMRIALSLASSVAEYGKNFFQNGAALSGVISMPGAGDRDKAREVKEIWEAGHSGVANSHRPAVMFGGAEWKPLSISNENAQFLGTREFSTEELCGWFGVPPQRIMSMSSHASQGGKGGLDTIDQGYATHTLVPITTTIEGVWDRMIPGGQQTFTRFIYEGLLRASALERAQIAQIDRLIGRRNRNELRADEGWSPIDGPNGTDYNIPFNTNTTLPGILEPGETDPALVDPADPTNGALA
jgi:HK97 family phage portal protein